MPLDVGGKNSLYWKTGLDNRGLRKDASSAKGIISSVLKQISALDVAIVAATWAALKTKRFIKDATILAARYETLGVVLRTVGINAGYTSEQMDEFARGLEEQGISMLKARQTLVQMMQAQMDLTKASELARIAQDAAVIGNINSSEAFNRMITGIQQGRLIILRTIGLNVQFERAYKAGADAIGKNADELTEYEKVQIRTNVIMEAGTRIAGVYEASMTTAGKQMLSLVRHLENLKVLMGALFTPLLAETIGQITEGVTGLNEGLLKNEEVIIEWGETFRLTLLKIEAEVMRVAMTLDLLGNSMFRVSGILAEMGKLIETQARKMWPLVLIPEGVGSMFGGISKKAAEAMLETEKRFTETFEKYEKLVSDYIILEASMTDAAKEEAEKRRKIAEKELLRLQKLAEQAKTELPDVSVWGLLTPEEIDDFAVEMTLLREKESEEAEKIAKRGLKTNRELLNEILKDTRKFNKDQLQDYIKYLNQKLKLTEDNAELQEAIYQEMGDIIDKIYKKEIEQIEDIAQAISELSSLLNIFNIGWSRQASNLSAIFESIATITAAATTSGVVGGIIGIITSFVSMFSGLFTHTERLGTSIQRLNKAIESTNQLLGRQSEVLSRLVGEEYLEEFAWTIQMIRNDYNQALRDLEEYRAIHPRRPGERASEMEKELGRRVQELYETLGDLELQYSEIITGTTRESIANAIADGFMDGLDSAKIFADTFQDLMEGALSSAFKRIIMTKFVDDWYDTFAMLTEDGLSPEELKILAGLFQAGLQDMQEAWDIISPMFETMGEVPTGMTGAIAGITEKTAGILAGQFNAMRMTSVQVLGQLVNINEGKLMPSLNALREIRNNTYNLQGILNRMNDVVWNTERIAKNTDYNIHLESIDSKLTNISNFARVIGG